MTHETRADYLRRNIAEVRYQRNMLQNRSRLDIVEDSRLRRVEQTMRLELHEIEPWQVHEHGPHWIVAHKGMFVTDPNSKDWLYFDTPAAAEAWIDQQLEDAA